jgi:WD40 repeat protein
MMGPRKEPIMTHRVSLFALVCLWGGEGPAQAISPRATLRSHSDEVHGVAYFADGKAVASCGDDRAVRVHDVATGKVVRTFRHTAGLWYVAVSPDGRTIVSANWDGTATLWDVAAGKARAVLRGHRSTVRRVAIAPDGKTVGTASIDGTAKLWDTASGKLLHSLQHTKQVRCVAFSPDGKTVATGGTDKVIRLWDVVTGREKAVLRGYPDRVNSLAFTPDGKVLVAGGENGFLGAKELRNDPAQVKLWDVATGKERGGWKARSWSIEAVAVSPRGHLLATGGGDGMIRLWDVATGRELAVLKGHGDVVEAVAFSPDGKVLASSGKDETVRLWDVPGR